MSTNFYRAFAAFGALLTAGLGVAGPARAGGPVWTREIPRTETGSSLLATLPDGSVVIATRWFRWVKTGPHERTGDGGTLLARYSPAGSRSWLIRSPSKHSDSVVVGLGVADDGTIVTASGERYNGFYSKALAVTRRDAQGKLLGRRVHDEPSDATIFNGFTLGPDGSSFLVASADMSNDPQTNRQGAFLRKYAPNGAFAWQRFLGKNQNTADRSAALVTLPDGGVVVAREQDVDGRRTSGERTPYGNEIALTAFDARGRQAWTGVVNPGGMASVGGLAVSGGEIYLAGTTYRPIAGHPLAGDGDVFVARYSLAGKLTDIAVFGGGDEDHANGIASLPGGGVIVTGATDSPSLNGIETHAADDAFAVTLNAGLEVQATSVLGGPHLETGDSIASGGDGGVYLAIRDTGWYRDLYPEAQVSLVRLQ